MICPWCSWESKFVTQEAPCVICKREPTAGGQRFVLCADAAEGFLQELEEDPEPTQENVDAVRRGLGEL